MIPLKRTSIFTTVADNQTVVDIHVLQGERELAGDNRSLAKFSLVGIAPGPRGAPQIEVSFDMDADGILSISARDRVSGKQQAVKVTPSTGLSKDEIERMIFEGKQFADNDRKARQIAELRNRVQGRMAALARSYSDFGRFLDPAGQARVKEALQYARNLPPEETSVILLEEILERLEDGAAKLASAMFNAPEEDLLQAGGRMENRPETDLNQLLESALKSVEPKT
jgi:molecular chaperone DnaK